jgi:hypothetical protein
MLQKKRCVLLLNRRLLFDMLYERCRETCPAISCHCKQTNCSTSCDVFTAYHETLQRAWTWEEDTLRACYVEIMRGQSLTWQVTEWGSIPSRGTGILDVKKLAIGSKERRSAYLTASHYSKVRIRGFERHASHSPPWCSTYSRQVSKKSCDSNSG